MGDGEKGVRESGSGDGKGEGKEGGEGGLGLGGEGSGWGKGRGGQKNIPPISGRARLRPITSESDVDLQKLPQARDGGRCSRHLQQKSKDLETKRIEEHTS